MLHKKQLEMLTQSDASRVIEMAWEDRTPFEAIETLYGLTEPQVIRFMRRQFRYTIACLGFDSNNLLCFSIKCQ